jgi:HK97 family phage prohead protease
MTKREILNFSEVRFGESDTEGEIDVIAVPFNVVDSYRTTFDPAAFSFDEKRVPMLWSHNSSEVIGSWTQMWSTPKEMRAKGKINLDLSKGREVWSMLKNKDIDGVSAQFRTIKDELRSGGIRHILKVKLLEISIVAIPAVPGAKVVSVRSGRESATADFMNAVRSATSALQGK